MPDQEQLQVLLDGRDERQQVRMPGARCFEVALVKSPRDLQVVVCRARVRLYADLPVRSAYILGRRADSLYSRDP